MRRLSHLHSLVIYLVSVGVAPTLAQAQAIPPSDQIVILGPDGPIKEQVRYLMSTWPDKFAIAVVEAVEEPQCHRVPKGPVDSGRITYCSVRVKPVELIVARWQDRPPQAWGDPFEMNYWFPREDKPQDTTRFEVSKGNRLVALLAPTRTDKPIYSCDYLAHATESLVDSVRQAVTDALRR
jgi:hypothetical protein